MPTIIKASDHGQGIEPVSFNFDDMAQKASDYLTGVRAQAGKVMTEAEREAKTIRKRAEEEARAQGYAEGQQQIHQIVEKKLAEQLGTLLPALAATIQEIQHAKQAWLTHWEKSAVSLATAMAERIVRRELEQKPEITLELVRESLQLAAGSSTVRVLLNPKDHEALQPRAEALIGDMAGLGACELVADPGVTPGGCKVETAFGTIDQQIEAQLKRIEEELT